MENLENKNLSLVKIFKKPLLNKLLKVADRNEQATKLVFSQAHGKTIKKDKRLILPKLMFVNLFVYPVSVEPWFFGKRNR